MVPYDTAPEEWTVLQKSATESKWIKPGLETSQNNVSHFETCCFGWSFYNPAKKSSTIWLNSCGFSIFK